MRPRELVYYVVGGDASYVDLLEFSLKTLREGGNSQDVLVMCEESYVPHIAHLEEKYAPLFLHVTPPNPTHIHASMRKLDIFTWDFLGKYDKALFLDCDIVVCGSLDAIFEGMDRTDKLYVVPECQISAHVYISHSCLDTPYTHAQLQSMYKHRIFPFNAGQFGFLVSDTMSRHFTNVWTQKETTYDPKYHYYEQSFMNRYFNLNRAVSYGWRNHCQLVATAQSKATLNHFCYVPSGSAKLAAMMHFYEESFNLPQKNPYIPYKNMTVAIIQCTDSTVDLLAKTLPTNRQHFKSVYVVAGETDAATQAFCKDAGIECVVGLLEKAQKVVHAAHQEEWIVVLETPELILPDNFSDVLGAELVHRHILYIMPVEQSDLEVYVYYDKTKYKPATKPLATAFKRTVRLVCAATTNLAAAGPTPVETIAEPVLEATETIPEPKPVEQSAAPKVSSEPSEPLDDVPAPAPAPPSPPASPPVPAAKPAKKPRAKKVVVTSVQAIS